MTIKLSDIQEARKILDGIVLRTPLIADEKLSRQLGARLFLKAENLQRGGSFKIRGSYNKISRLTDAEKRRGVITASAGNHAQGVALAAKLHGIKATIVLPETAPLTKIAGTKSLGAEVVLKGENYDGAAEYARILQKKFRSTYIHAFDDELIIAGQGTIGFEIIEDCPKANIVVVPIGGGGIISGIAIAMKNLSSSVKVIGVQSENASPVKPSLKAGRAMSVNVTPTIADGIAIKRPGKVTFPIIKKYVDEVVTVSDEEIARAIFHCVQNTRLVVEGAGAAGLAALLAGKIKLKKKDNVCAVLCGGNIDANLLARVLEQVMVREGRYVIFKVLVPDRPGALALLLNQVAESRANVIEVFHRRSMWLAPLGTVGIEMVLEVRDEEHGRDVFQHLRKMGYDVEREGVGDW